MSGTRAEACGEKMTLGVVQRRESGVGGSGSMASSPAPARLPLRMASHMAVSSTIPPREMIMMWAVGFISAMRRLSMEFMDSLVYGQATTNQSDIAMRSSSLSRPPDFFGVFGWSWVFVYGVDVHVESGGAFSDSASDVAEAVDAEGCVFEFDLSPCVAFGSPLARHLLGQHLVQPLGE